MDQITTAETAVQRQSIKTHYLTFTGSGAEYFRIWIVNLLLTILTLGIYSAWAKVRRLRYFYGNTFLDGTAFEYHGDPLKILKGRLIAAAFVVPFAITTRVWPIAGLGFLGAFVLALPFIVVLSRRFQARNSSWRNIRFSFDGTFGQAAIVYLVLSLLVPVTLGLIIPYIFYRREKFLIGRLKFGATAIEFGGPLFKYYLAFLSGIALAVIGTAVFLFLGNWWLGPIFKRVFLDAEPYLVWQYKGQFIMLWVLWFYLVYFTYAIVQAGLINASYGHLKLGAHRVQSEVETAELAGILLINLLFMSLTFGVYAPWAKLRVLQYRIDSLSIVAQDGLQNFVAAEGQDTTATGSELGDLLNWDFGI